MESFFLFGAILLPLSQYLTHLIPSFSEQKKKFSFPKIKRTFLSAEGLDLGRHRFQVLKKHQR